MKSQTTFGVFSALVFVTLLTITPPAQSLGQSGALVRLQPTSPGVPQSGNLNVSGTVLVGGFRLGSSATPGHVLTANASGVGSWQVPTSQGWSLSGNNLNNTNSGNVGIGTTSPAQQLSITGGLGFANQNAADKRLWSPTDGVLRWQTNNNATGHAFEVGHQSSTASVRLDTAGNSWITGGSLGIGTASPIHALDVNGRLSLSGGVIQRGGSPITITSDLGLYSQVEGQFVRLVTNAAHIALFTDGGAGTSPRMVVAPSGNVGIGTGFFPDSKLQVNGTVHSQVGGFKFPNGSVQNNASNDSSGFVDYVSSGSFTVPTGVNRLKVEMWGGGGGGSANGLGYGGSGAYVRCVLSVSPGQQLTVVVGGGGQVGQAGGPSTISNLATAGGGQPGVGDGDGAGGIATSPNGIAKNGTSFPEFTPYSGRTLTFTEGDGGFDAEPGLAGYVIIEW